MCTSIGVDPLASSKGFWSEMLGFGDFYYELAVQVPISQTSLEMKDCVFLQDYNYSWM